MTRVNCGAPSTATTRLVIPEPMLTSAVASPPGRALVDEGDRRRHRAHEREGLQVDAVDGEAGLLRRLE